MPAKSDDGFGIVRYKSRTPFATDAGDWGRGKFVLPEDPEREHPRHGHLA